MKILKVHKGQQLQQAGEFNTKVYSVKSGLLRSYSLDAKGKEHIFMFAPEHWTIADSIGPESPCDLYIEALEDSVVWVRDKQLKSEKDAEALIKRINVLQQRVIMLMSSSALERYQHFVATYSGITQRVPQRMIASYLGVTPETLSAAKAKAYKTKK